MLQHADAFVSSPYRNNLLCSSPSVSPQTPATIVAVLSLLSSGLPSLRSILDWHSNPIAYRVRRKRQRLPPSLLIENASHRLFPLTRSVCPRRFRSRLATIHELASARGHESCLSLLVWHRNHARSRDSLTRLFSRTVFFFVTRLSLEVPAISFRRRIGDCFQPRQMPSVECLQKHRF